MNESTSPNYLYVTDCFPTDFEETTQDLQTLGLRRLGRARNGKLKVPYSLRRTLGETTQSLGHNQTISLLANKSSFGCPDSISQLFSSLRLDGHKLALVYQASGYAGSPDILDLARENGFFLGNCPDITTQEVAKNLMPLMHEIFSGTSIKQGSACQIFRQLSYLEKWKKDWTAGLPSEALQAALKKPLPKNCFDGKVFVVVGSARPRTFGAHLAKEIEALGGTVEFYSVWGSYRDAGKKVLLEKLPEADAVLLATQLTDDTLRLVDDEFLNRMKQDAILASVARGPMVIEHYLEHYAKKLRFIIDVARSEPLTETSYRIFENVLNDSPDSVVTAHSLHLSEDTVKTLSLQSYCLLAIANGIDKETFLKKLGLEPSQNCPYNGRVSIPSLGWVTHEFLEEGWSLVPSQDEPNIFVAA